MFKSITAVRGTDCRIKKLAAWLKYVMKSAKAEDRCAYEPDPSLHAQTGGRSGAQIQRAALSLMAPMPVQQLYFCDRVAL